MIHDTELTLISKQIEQKLGLLFPKNRFQDLKRALNTALPEIGFGNDTSLFSHALISNSLTQHQLDTLALYLTIGETYFFREKICLNVFIQTIIPAIIKHRDTVKRELRIWSAGCCTGEEAYTIAILLTEALPDITDWNITIIGTDINRNFIQKAKNARYTQWSFRDTPDDLKKKYFTQIGKEFEVNPEIRNMVTFLYLNLADNKFPSVETNTFAMDVIFCRNVLMYFSTDQASKVVLRFKECLVHEGWFITSPVEFSNSYFSIFHQVVIDDAMVYRKVKWNKHHEPHPSIAPVSEMVLINEQLDLNSSYYHELQKQQIEPIVKQPKHPNEANVNDLYIDVQKIHRLIDGKRYNDASMQLQKLIVQHPANDQLKFLLATVFANIGQHAKARILCEELISRNKMNTDYYYLLATILFDDNEKEAAERLINQVLYIDPNHLLACFLKGNIARVEGKSHMAVKHYRNLLKLIQDMNDTDIIADAGGLTVGRLKAMVINFI